MREGDITVSGIGTTQSYTTLADLKLRVAEHVLAQAGSYQSDDVQNILAETKVGALRRGALLEKLRIIFSVS
jgi:hypothetical protein